MVNYLALLGWNDGTDKEIYSRDELIEAFSLERVIASPAMFDDDKLRWINGQHLRALPVSALAPLVAEFLAKDGVLPAGGYEAAPAIAFVETATTMAQPKAELIVDVSAMTLAALTYPLRATLSAAADEQAAPAERKRIKQQLDDGFADFAAQLADSFEQREAPAWCYADFQGEVRDDGDADFAAWIARLGERTDRAKKRLLMPARLALTGQAQGPDVGAQLRTLALAARAQVAAPGLVPLAQRIEELKQWARGTAAGATDENSSLFDPAAPSATRPAHQQTRRHAPKFFFFGSLDLGRVSSGAFGIRTFVKGAQYRRARTYRGCFIF